MNKEITITEDEKQAIEYVKSIKEFYSHLVTYLLVITGLFVINYFTSPDYWWAVWPALGWGIGIVSHALSAFEILNIFGPDWERKQVEKRLGRKL